MHLEPDYACITTDAEASAGWLRGLILIALGKRIQGYPLKSDTSE